LSGRRRGEAREACGEASYHGRPPTLQLQERKT
jgi:hypothetical protein